MRQPVLGLLLPALMQPHSVGEWTKLGPHFAREPMVPLLPKEWRRSGGELQTASVPSVGECTENSMYVGRHADAFFLRFPLLTPALLAA